MSTSERYLRARKSAGPAHDRWLLSYADLVTLLLAVFVVLFASLRHKNGSIHTLSTAIQAGFESLGMGSEPPYKTTNSTMEALSQSAARDAASKALAVQLQRVFESAISKQEVTLQFTNDGITLRLQDLGFFESGNAALVPRAVQELQRTGRVLERYNLDMRVEGHSDAQPIHTAAFQSNWELSTARAMSVLSVLVNETGFPADHIAVMGYGPYRPIADNATEEGRQKNRRVDLVIVMPHRGGHGGPL